jgi:invasion protein IalB
MGGSLRSLAILTAILSLSSGAVAFSLAPAKAQDSISKNRDTTAPDPFSGRQTLSTSASPPTASEPPVLSTHGDWQIRCDTPAGSQNKQCALMQSFTDKTRENVGLTVVVLQMPDGRSHFMRILAPLGVLIPPGLGLRIDQLDMGRTGFVRCTDKGCIAEVILDDTLLNTLRNGKTATFFISQKPEEGIGMPISLNGFGPGFDALP